jgi:hypothetical protein
LAARSQAEHLADQRSAGGSAGSAAHYSADQRWPAEYSADQRSADGSAGSAAYCSADQRLPVEYLADQRSAGGSADSAAHYSADQCSQAAWPAGYFAERCSAADCLAAAPVDSRSEAGQAG